MRLFIAADLPEEMLGAMAEAREVLRRHAGRISLTRDQNLHLTLRFLGEVQQEKLPGLRRLIRSLTFGGSMALTHYGSFPSPEGLTLWAGLRLDEAALHMARQAEKGLRALGFPPENRPFVPHVTLARRAELLEPLERLRPLLPLRPEAVPLAGLALYQSLLGPGGSRYTALERLENPLFG